MKRALITCLLVFAAVAILTALMQRAGGQPPKNLYTVRQYSGGHIVGEWHCYSYSAYNGVFYFREIATRKKLEISGDIAAISDQP